MKINSQLVFALLLQSFFHLSAQENVNRINQFGAALCRNITISDSDLFFLLECNPVFIKNETNDSLQLGLRFYEMDPGGELRRDYFHNVNYSLRIGNRIIRKDSIRLWNTRETAVKCRVPVIQPQDTLMVVNLSIKSGERNINKDFFIPLSRQPDIQFFPEGGSMIYGLESKVAFKAIGQDGLSCEVTGCIRDQNGKVIFV